MSVINTIAVSRKLEPYFLKEKSPDNAACLLKAVRLALEDIRKKEPAVAGLDVTEISFLREQTGEISLRFFFA